MSNKTTLFWLLLGVILLAWCAPVVPRGDTEPENIVSVEDQEHPQVRLTWNTTCDRYLEFLSCQENNYPGSYREDYREDLLTSFDDIPHDQLEEICSVLVELDTRTWDDTNSCVQEFYSPQD